MKLLILSCNNMLIITLFILFGVFGDGTHDMFWAVAFCINLLAALISVIKEEE